LRGCDCAADDGAGRQAYARVIVVPAIYPAAISNSAAVIPHGATVISDSAAVMRNGAAVMRNGAAVIGYGARRQGI
jgi:hypothetical protein